MLNMSLRNLTKFLEQNEEDNSSVDQSEDVDTHSDNCMECDRGGSLLLCEGYNCSNVIHLACCTPPLYDVPDEQWFCSFCAVLQATTPIISRKNRKPRRRRQKDTMDVQNQ